MSEREKAEELVAKFENTIVNRVQFVGKEQLAKECALIAVDEIIGEINQLQNASVASFTKANTSMNGYDKISFWNRVKTEIQSL